jgi:hypothetical protein
MSRKNFVKIALPITAAGALLATSVAGFALANSTSASASSYAKDGTPSGYQIVALPNKNVPNFKRRTALCPHPKRVIGGGAEAQGPNAVLVGSFPTPDGRGWIALGRQTSGRTVGISVFAICAY